MRVRATVTALGVLSAASVVLFASPASAKLVDNPCQDVESVFARGSGQETGDRQATRFEEQLALRINSPVTLNSYELGLDESSGGYGGDSYEAIDVDNPLNGNPIGARFSGGNGFDYGRSVDSGVGELFNYLIERQAKCVDARFVLGGFSQGAQVIGQTVTRIADERPAMLDRIDFAAMFGDPQLHLPEGEGIFAPACRGEEFSTWRRTVPDCQTDNGSLGARRPYLPPVMTSKSGLWCYDDDFVCGSDKNPLETAGHTYFDEGGAVDDAAREIAERLRTTLSAEKAPSIDISLLTFNTGTTGLDVAFVIDTTGSMGGRIEQAKLFANAAAASIKEQRGRVALIAYKDAGDVYTAQVFSGLQGELTDFQTKLSGLFPSGGGDTPEAVLHALTTTLNGLDWRPGATKAAVLLTDAGFHHPDRVDGSTIASVAARALEIDPVNVYPVVPSFLATTYQPLAEATTGQVIVDSGNSAAALTTALTKIRNRPVVLLPLVHYYGQPGESFTFDASRSYVTGSTISSFQWDFEGDGTFELTTTTPRATHTYATAFDGVMQVRANAADGGVANASAFVHVGTPQPDQDLPAAPTGLRTEVVSTAADGVSTVRLSWTAADERAAAWAITVDGVPVGLADGATRSVELTDLERGRSVELGVAGQLADKRLGDRATRVLPKADAEGAVAIDIRPDSLTNPINLRTKGVVPVAVLSEPGLDAGALDIGLMCFGDAEQKGERDCTPRHATRHLQDVDGDGLQDLVLHFDVQETGIDAGDSSACLSGRRLSGTAFESCDTIVTVPNR